MKFNLFLKIITLVTSYRNIGMGKMALKLCAVCIMLICFIGCDCSTINEINIGYIGPLSKRATDLGIGPSNALKLAVDQYNAAREADQPKINLFIEDDQWEKDNALPAYRKLREQHAIDVLFISNTDGTIALQDDILKDKVILINPLNSDSLLSSMNHNTFKIAKSTEDTNGLIGIRIIELGLKKALIMHYPNDFMTRATTSCKKLLDQVGIESKVIMVDKEATDFTDELQEAAREGFDAYVFFGYKEFGFAMKQARELGITAPFFGSTVLLDPDYYVNSEGTIVGSECCFFTPTDGNYMLANEFLTNYEQEFGGEPASLWPPMQAYDAMNIVLNEIKAINETKATDEPIDGWLRKQLFKVRYYQGVCGNISITEDGASKGIYFSLYKYASEGKLVKIRR